MEQRLAEFRAARKRAGQAAQPCASSQTVQTLGEKAEAVRTPEAASGWLRRFLILVRKPRPANARVPPSRAQVRGQRPLPPPGLGDAAMASVETAVAPPPRRGHAQH